MSRLAEEDTFYISKSDISFDVKNGIFVFSGGDTKPGLNSGKSDYKLLMGNFVYNWSMLRRRVINNILKITRVPRLFR